MKKKHKGMEKTLKPNHVKAHMKVFVNCLIENPAFDSQTKENMTLKQSAFGSKCTRHLVHHHRPSPTMTRHHPPNDPPSPTMTRHQPSITHRDPTP